MKTINENGKTVRFQFVATFEIPLHAIEAFLSKPDVEQRAEMMALIRQTPACNERIYDHTWDDIRKAIGLAMVERREKELRQLCEVNPEAEKAAHAN
jgi:hypothetical protein